jgi:hypothetical protein
VDQTRARAVGRIGVEQAINVLKRPAAALGGKAERLVDDDGAGVAMQTMESASSSCASVKGLRARTPLPPPIPTMLSPGGTRRV